MTRAIIVFANNSCGFSVFGHAGGREYAGRDTVCAAISSAVYMAANTVTDVLKIKADIDLDDGRFVFVAGDNRARDALMGLAIHLKQLSGKYPDKLNVKILTQTSEARQ